MEKRDTFWAVRPPRGAIKGAVAPQRHRVDPPCTHRPPHQTRLASSPQLWKAEVCRSIVPIRCAKPIVHSSRLEGGWGGGGRRQTQSCRCAPFAGRHVAKWWVACRTPEDTAREFALQGVHPPPQFSSSSSSSEGFLRCSHHPSWLPPVLQAPTPPTPGPWRTLAPRTFTRKGKRTGRRGRRPSTWEHGNERSV